MLKRVVGGADKGSVRLRGGNDGEGPVEIACGESFTERACVVEEMLVHRGVDEARVDAVVVSLQGASDLRSSGVVGSRGAAKDRQAGDGLGGALGGGEEGDAAVSAGVAAATGSSLVTILWTNWKTSFAAVRLFKKANISLWTSWREHFLNMSLTAVPALKVNDLAEVVDECGVEVNEVVARCAEGISLPLI
eukprot:GFKZ01001806.1.p2 GENE.GFKZ01001806.1~~GFKZ01001806.1.p2  ORF type:complete len:192 (-),score=23.44 GFKZ01001806.1:2902-3477(-)